MELQDCLINKIKLLEQEIKELKDDKNYSYYVPLIRERNEEELSKLKNKKKYYKERNGELVNLLDGKNQYIKEKIKLIECLRKGNQYNENLILELRDKLNYYQEKYLTK